MMAKSLHTSIQFGCTHCCIRSSTPPLSLVTHCALTKQGQRFLTSVSTKAVGDSATISRMINKFVASSPKHVSLSTLSHLMSPNSAHQPLSLLTLPLYTRISEASWFSWNSKLVADVIALLYKQGLVEEAEVLTSDTISRVCLKERDLVAFRCHLTDSHSKLKSEQAFFESAASLREITSLSSSNYVKRRAYESLVGGFCAMGLPHEAESVIREMNNAGVKASVFEMRSTVEAYGRLGMFDDMLRIVAAMGSEGFELDTVCSNMILSSYGLHGELSQMALWIQKMKASGIGFSVRTYNSVLNSCPTINLLLKDLKSCPVSIKELTEALRGDESQVVEELIGATFLSKIIEWTAERSKLDLHGMHQGTAYLMVLQWVEELRCRFTSRDYRIPGEVTVVCGMGKHSNTKGNSPVKFLVKELMRRMGTPLKIDRKNGGCFVAKGKVVKDWLC